MINESLWWFFSGSIATGSLLQFANWKITMKIVGTVNHRTNVFSMLCEIIAGCMNVSNKCGFQSIQHRYLWFSRKRTCGLENRYILTWLVGGFNPEECARHWRSSSSSLSLSSLSSVVVVIKYKRKWKMRHVWNQHKVFIGLMPPTFPSGSVPAFTSTNSH